MEDSVIVCDHINGSHMGSGGGKPKNIMPNQKTEQELTNEEEIIQRLTSLNLPNMPSADQMRNDREPPTLRILVVADIDLESASALAESALATSARQTSGEKSQTGTTKIGNPLHAVDLCVACGPFCREDDLRQYYQGRQRRRHLIRQYYSHPSRQQHAVHVNNSHNIRSSTSSSTDCYSAPTQVFLNSNLSSAGMSLGGGGATSGLGGSYPIVLPPPSQPVFHSDRSPPCPSSPISGRHNIHHQNVPPRCMNNAPTSTTNDTTYPYKRSREETAAVEGLVTAAISQLESIVCRVVVVPGGKTDPVTISIGQGCDDEDDQDWMDEESMHERRLTPNSRNIHQRWMPIGPGLGIAGLAYLEWKKLQQEPPPETNRHESNDDDSDIEEEDEEDSFENLNEAEPPILNSNHDVNMVSPEHCSTTKVDDSNEALEQLRKSYGSKFCQELLELVESAPPISSICQLPPAERTHPLVDELLRSSLFQTILVTQFHHWQPPEDMQKPGALNGTSSDHGTGDSDSDDECFDPPWPSEHEAFCAQPLIQDQVVLEIAAGFNSKGATAQPMELPKGKMKVVLPGSLRERGEFCLVDVAFMKDPSSAALKTPRSSRSVSPPKSSGDYRWMVRQTRFHCLNDFV